MAVQIPSYFSFQYSSDEIQNKVKDLGEKITTWATQVQAESSEDLLCVPVLRGGIFFFADLVRSIQCSVEIAPINSRSYVPGVNQQTESEVKVELGSLNPEGRSLLLVDDICDSGRTLASLSQMLLKNGAAEVRSAVLVHRIVDNPPTIPDYSAFEYTGKEWFVGYGMEDGNRYRNLPDIYKIIGEPT